MPDEVLRASEAARRLAIPTKELLRLIRDRRIRYVMVDGIAHVPADAIEEYRAGILIVTTGGAWNSTRGRLGTGCIGCAVATAPSLAREREP